MRNGLKSLGMFGLGVAIGVAAKYLFDNAVILEILGDEDSDDYEDYDDGLGCCCKCRSTDDASVSEPAADAVKPSAAVSFDGSGSCQDAAQAMSCTETPSEDADEALPDDGLGF